jgi:hypothetical protein
MIIYGPNLLLVKPLSFKILAARITASLPNVRSSD